MPRHITRVRFRRRSAARPIGRARASLRTDRGRATDGAPIVGDPQGSAPDGVAAVERSQGTTVAEAELLARASPEERRALYRRARRAALRRALRRIVAAPFRAIVWVAATLPTGPIVLVVLVALLAAILPGDPKDVAAVGAVVSESLFACFMIRQARRSPAIVVVVGDARPEPVSERPLTPDASLGDRAIDALTAHWLPVEIVSARRLLPSGELQDLRLTPDARIEHTEDICAPLPGQRAVLVCLDGRVAIGRLHDLWPGPVPYEPHPSRTAMSPSARN